MVITGLNNKMAVELIVTPTAKNDKKFVGYIIPRKHRKSPITNLQEVRMLQKEDIRRLYREAGYQKRKEALTAKALQAKIS